MITIDNQQSMPLNLDLIQKNAQRILDYLGYQDFDLGILFTDNNGIHEYNNEYRGKDKPTDILSFPFHPNLKAGEKINALSEDEKNVGDIIICPEYIKADLERWGQTFEQRMDVLLVHGICHLLGYDHIEDEDYAIMKQKEEELLALLDS